MPLSVDGYQWTPDAGFVAGVPTDAVIEPSTFNADTDALYDAIVVGTGYAGLRVLRDLTTQGRKVLVLEGRDRIGGRTCSVKEDGYTYEVGGTWVHRNQAHVWAEIVRYGFDGRLEDSQEFHEHSRTPTIVRDGELQEIPYIDQAAIRGFEKFFDIDGKGGSSVFDLHREPGWLNNEDFAKWDAMSCQDRLNQVKEKLSPEEEEGIENTILLMNKGPMSRASFADVLRWPALSGGNFFAFGQHYSRWKLADGQTALALAMFNDALASGNLSYRFSAVVSDVDCHNGASTVTANDGQVYKAASVAIAVPLNCVADIQFSPALDLDKADAIAKGHTNYAYKVCVEAKGKSWRNWTGYASPHKGLPFLIGDGITPAGNSYLISTPGDYIDPEANPDKLLEAVRYMHPELELLRVFGMNYHSHPLSKGGWAVHSPGFVSKYLRSLQASAGNVHFASADWADVWRGFIDGALESGARASRTILQDTSKLDVSTNKANKL